MLTSSLEVVIVSGRHFITGSIFLQLFICFHGSRVLLLAFIAVLPDSLARLKIIPTRSLSIVHCLGRMVPVQSWKLVSRSWQSK